MGIRYYPERRQPLPITWRGEYNSSNTYYVDDIVLWNGSTYYATGSDINGTFAPPGGDWELFTSKGNTGDPGPQPEFLSSLKIQHSPLTPTAGTVLVNFAQNGMLTNGPLTGNVTYTGSNYIDGVTVSVRIVGGSSTYSLTFPSGWKFVSSKPLSLAANKTGVLSLTCFGNAESNVVAAWVAEA